MMTDDRLPTGAQLVTSKDDHSKSDISQISNLRATEPVFTHPFKRN